MADAVTRTEEATPKRREEARREGLVVVSPQLAPAAMLLLVAGTGTYGAPILLERLRVVVREWLAASGPLAVADDPLGALAWRSLVLVATVLVPLCAAIAVVAAGAVVAQVGWHPAPGLVAPDPARIGLAAGRRRLVSLDAVARLVKAAVTIGLVLALGTRVLLDVGRDALDAASLPVDALFGLAGDGLRRLGLAVAAGLAVVGIAEWAWARRCHERTLRMSRHELREELRQSEGDPRVRRRMHRSHRELVTRGTTADVARADVVIADGERIAIALGYREGEDAAPRVLVAGAHALAARIARAARAAGVPIVERRALARTLLRAAPAGREVPPAVHRATAEVLAYVYSTRRGRPEAAA